MNLGFYLGTELTSFEVFDLIGWLISRIELDLFSFTLMSNEIGRFFSGFREGEVNQCRLEWTGLRVASLDNLENMR